MPSTVSLVTNTGWYGSSADRPVQVLEVGRADLVPLRLVGDVPAGALPLVLEQTDHPLETAEARLAHRVAIRRLLEVEPIPPRQSPNAPNSRAGSRLTIEYTPRLRNARVTGDGSG